MSNQQAATAQPTVIELQRKFRMMYSDALKLRNWLVERERAAALASPDAAAPAREPEPECPGPKCQMCSGEYCAEHLLDPCECDSADRHMTTDVKRPASDAAAVLGSTPQIVCACCEKEAATCFGVYEDPADPVGPACDKCCGHGNEDGWCKPISELPTWAQEQRARADAFEDRAVLGTGTPPQEPHDGCEWSPTRGDAAYGDDPHYLAVQADVLVGAGKNNYRLCHSCASHSRFDRFKKTPIRRAVIGIGTPLRDADECPHCKGVGFTPAQDFTECEDNCPTCHGSGLVAESSPEPLRDEPSTVAIAGSSDQTCTARNDERYICELVAGHAGPHRAFVGDKYTPEIKWSDVPHAAPGEGLAWLTRDVMQEAVDAYNAPWQYDGESGKQFMDRKINDARDVLTAAAKGT